MRVAIAVTAVIVLAPGLSAQGRATGPQPQRKAAEGFVRLDNHDDRSTLRSEAYRAPCFSADTLGNKPKDLTEDALADRVELKLRAVGLDPIPYNKCGLPEYGRELASPEQVKRIFVAVEPLFHDDGTFDISVSAYRIVKWPTSPPKPDDDGFRGRLLEVDSYHEPEFFPGRQTSIRYDGRSATVMDAIDRAMDRFLVDYLRQNKQQ